jgi:hypothetical protein
MKRNVMLVLAVGLALVLLSALELVTARSQASADAAASQTLTIFGVTLADGAVDALLNDFADRTGIATQYEQIEGPNLSWPNTLLRSEPHRSG